MRSGLLAMLIGAWLAPAVALAFDEAIPVEPGGSLAVDSAPASAVIGATETVDISWSGLAPGTHLGAVSHTGDSGLMGLTRVEVENP